MLTLCFMRTGVWAHVRTTVKLVFNPQMGESPRTEAPGLSEERFDGVRPYAHRTVEVGHRQLKTYEAGATTWRSCGLDFRNDFRECPKPLHLCLDSVLTVDGLGGSAQTYLDRA